MESNHHGLPWSGIQSLLSAIAHYFPKAEDIGFEPMLDCSRLWLSKPTHYQTLAIFHQSPSVSRELG